VDFPLRQIAEYLTDESVLCFNPCCSGFSVKTEIDLSEIISNTKGFNPCCSGFSVKTKKKELEEKKIKLFQSLL